MEDVLKIIEHRDINIKDNYRYETNRVESFTTWPKNNPVSPSDLAKAGFYYKGIEDEVRCFQCHVLVRDWAAADRPLSVHKNRSPRCHFILGYDVGNVQLVAHDEVVSSDKVGLHGEEQNFTAAMSLLNSVGTEVPEDLCDPQKLTRMLEHAAHPEYGDIVDRFRSFSRWTSGNTHPATKMCQAGFFYTGEDDRVDCFMCGGGLWDWEPDDIPWQEHARWFNRCEYLDACRNVPEVNTAIYDAQKSQRRGVGTEAATAEDGSYTQAICTEEDSDDVTEQKDLNELIAENEALRDTIRCKVCWMNDVTILFLPCRHLISCLYCSLRLDKCPVCRGLIKASVRVFCSVFD